MNYTPKTNCSLGKYTNEGFIEKTSDIQGNLLQVPYGAVLPSPATVTPLIEQMRIYHKESKERNHKNSLQLKLIRKQITELLKLQSASVNGLANGDVDYMVNSGFDMNKVPAPIPEPLMPTIMFIKPLKGGSVIVKNKAVPYTDYYQSKFTGPGGFVKWQTSLYSKVKVPDLPTGVTLTVMVRAVNNKGIGEWSNSQNFELPSIASQSNSGEE